LSVDLTLVKSIVLTSLIESISSGETELVVYLDHIVVEG